MPENGNIGPTEAAMSAHRFERPLGFDDEFSEVPMQELKLDVPAMVDQVQQVAKERATAISNKHPLPRETKSTKEEMAEAMTKRILGLLILSRYRRGPVEFVANAQDVFSAKIKAAVMDGKPVELILSFFGSKVQNPLKTWAQQGTEVDISEMGSLLRFYEISEAIRGMYAPGAVFHIACDGRKYADSIGFSEAQGRGYFERIALMCKMMRIDHAVRLFDEADHYPPEHKQNVERHYERVVGTYASGDVAMRTMITKLQASMCLSMPVSCSGIDIVDLRLAFSTLNNADLAAKRPKAVEVRQHLVENAFRSSLRYVACYDAVKEENVIEQYAPNALRATVHPKPGQLGLYAINTESHGIFPHHGQGVMKADIADPKVGGIRIAFRADLERSVTPVEGYTLSPDAFPFSDGKHPFIVRVI